MEMEMGRLAGLAGLEATRKGKQLFGVHGGPSWLTAYCI